MVIHKSVFAVVGMFNPEMKSGSDIDLWFRIALKYPEIGYSHCVAANIYKRNNSISYSKSFDYDKSLSFLREREQLAASLGDLVRKRAEPRIMYWVTNLLRSCISRSNEQAVKKLLSIYKSRLAFPWYMTAHAFLIAPYVFKLVFTLRNRFSSKRRAFRIAGF
jgi:hypothetical protein